MYATEWKPWFAWHRVQVGDQKAWLKIVYRRRCEVGVKSWYEYSLEPDSTLLEKQLQVKINKLERELEIERVRLAACGVIAMANTRKALAQHTNNMHPDYQCASITDVKTAVEREIKLREELEAGRVPWRWVALGETIPTEFCSLTYPVYVSRLVNEKKDADVIVKQWLQQGFNQTHFSYRSAPVYLDRTVPVIPEGANSDTTTPSIQSTQYTTEVKELEQIVQDTLESALYNGTQPRTLPVTGDNTEGDLIQFRGVADSLEMNRVRRELEASGFIPDTKTVQRIVAVAQKQSDQAEQMKTISDLMRTIDAYVFDYSTMGKLALSRVTVEKELIKALTH